MKYSVAWSPSAQYDLESILDYISSDSIDAAKKQFSKIQERCVKLVDTPKVGRVIPELQLQNIKSYRELVVAPWRIMYKVKNKKIVILAVIDSRRNIDDALLNRSLGR
ncbi:MAG: type II toxin-antitoxin system RelE/ParE family toxin [Fibrobacterales bacterium]